mmetsp:Transcript_29604/g.61719  ORF Transcript_29604/g.61719 Transcript_29604/m.61719 type:complete len:304 (-) Transcript_29604:1126-2037(-)
MHRGGPPAGVWLPSRLRSPRRRVRLRRRQPTHPEAPKRSGGGPGPPAETGRRIPRTHGRHRRRQRRGLPAEPQGHLQPAPPTGLPDGGRRVPRQLHGGHALGEPALRPDHPQGRHRGHQRVLDRNEHRAAQEVPGELSPARPPVRPRRGGRVPQHQGKLFLPVPGPNERGRLSPLGGIRRRPGLSQAVVLRGRDLLRGHLQARLAPGGAQPEGLPGVGIHGPVGRDEPLRGGRRRSQRGVQGKDRRRPAGPLRAGPPGDDPCHRRCRALRDAREPRCPAHRLRPRDRSHPQGLRRSLRPGGGG